MANVYKTMPRNPDAQGLEYQSSVYQDLGSAHLLICEVYDARMAEIIAEALNERFSPSDGCPRNLKAIPA